MQDGKEAFEAEMEEIRTQWQREKADRNRSVKEQAEATEKQRQREKEEYEYTLKNELACEKVQDIANRAVTSARRESYSAPVHPSNIPVRDES
jgi:septal ring factor EnvC (AmiA/AmiB activator)